MVVGRKRLSNKFHDHDQSGPRDCCTSGWSLQLGMTWWNVQPPNLLFTSSPSSTVAACYTLLCTKNSTFVSKWKLLHYSIYDRQPFNTVYRLEPKHSDIELTCAFSTSWASLSRSIWANHTAIRTWRNAGGQFCSCMMKTFVVKAAYHQLFFIHCYTPN